MDAEAGDEGEGVGAETGTKQTREGKDRDAGGAQQADAWAV